MSEENEEQEFSWDDYGENGEKLQEFFAIISSNPMSEYLVVSMYPGPDSLLN